MITANAFENRIWQMVQPAEGRNGLQLPRPWFTSYEDPQNARVFVVGANQRNGYPPAGIDVRQHFDGLFSRNGQTCAGIYARATGGRESPTRQRIRALFTEKLSRSGVLDILETNVVCRSSGYFNDLDAGERLQGSELFRFLLDTVRPRVIVVYGKGARKAFAQAMGKNREDITALLQRLEAATPTALCRPRAVEQDGMAVYVTPGLVMAGWQEWSSWADSYTDDLAAEIASRLARQV